MKTIARKPAAGNQPAKPQTACAGMAAATSLARLMDRDGEIPITVRVRLSPPEAVLLARMSLKTGDTVEEIIGGYLRGQYDCASGIQEMLNQEMAPA